MILHLLIAFICLHLLTKCSMHKMIVLTFKVKILLFPERKNKKEKNESMLDHWYICIFSSVWVFYRYSSFGTINSLNTSKVLQWTRDLPWVHCVEWMTNLFSLSHSGAHRIQNSISRESLRVWLSSG